LIDYASDLRAPTPTAAAERAVPVRSELLAQLATLASRHHRGLSRLMQERRTRVTAAARALPRPDEILALARQRFDSASNRLAQGLRTNTQSHRRRLAEVAPRLTLRAVSVSIAADRKTLATLQERSGRAVRRALDFKSQRLSGTSKLLTSLSYKSVLQRGFALVRDDKGQAVRAAAAVMPGQPLAIEFADGSVKVKEDSGPKQGRLL